MTNTIEIKKVKSIPTPESEAGKNTIWEILNKYRHLADEKKPFKLTEEMRREAEINRLRDNLKD